MYHYAQVLDRSLLPLLLCFFPSPLLSSSPPSPNPLDLAEKLSKKSPAKSKKKAETASPRQATIASVPAATSSSTKLSLSPAAKAKKLPRVAKEEVDDGEKMEEEEEEVVGKKKGKATGTDNSFHQFCQLCQDIERESSYNAKTKLVANYIQHGTSGGQKKNNDWCKNIAV